MTKTAAANSCSVGVVGLGGRCFSHPGSSGRAASPFHCAENSPLRGGSLVYLSSPLNLSHLPKLTQAPPPLPVTDALICFCSQPNSFCLCSKLRYKSELGPVSLQQCKQYLVYRLSDIYLRFARLHLLT